jgi:hypothetical protein
MWLRLYTDILNDPKVQRLSGEDFKGWINILALAKEHGGLIPPLEDVAFRLRTTEEETTRLVETLVKRGLLDTDGVNTTPHNWNGRQFESDSSTERVKRFRNVSETLPETEADTDTEPDTEQRPEASRGKPRSVRAPIPADDEFLDGLQKNPAYSMLNVRHCYQRMMTWCQVNGKQPSRRRFINWLNREDKPMTAPVKKQTGNANVGKAPPAPLALVADPVPGADEYMAEYVDDLIARNDFAQIGHEYDDIVERGGAKAEWEIRCVAWYELHKNEPASPQQIAELNASIQVLARKGK